MKISKLLGERIKETPSVATTKSYAYLLRAGYIKQVGSGIFTLLPPAQRVSLKIQNIIRQEMNKVDGQEVLFPVVMPREMWDLSGRYTSIGDEMVRFTDRNNHEMLLGMTHEEASVHACLNTIKSYTQLPFMVYQIQTKFRDEPRPRAGLIRVREFTMKDGYSFHENLQDLNDYYNRVFESYKRIYKRIGLKNVVAVEGDNGMMGGKVSHEFMLLTDIGEDSLIVCPHCGYSANQEVATCVPIKNKMQKSEPVKEVFTNELTSINDVAHMLNKTPADCCKAVCYAIKGDANKVVVAFIRGDKEVNECKLSKVVKAEVALKENLTENGLVAGCIGPLNLKVNNAIVVFDSSLKDLCGAVVGANKKGYHFINVDFGRDVKPSEYFDISQVKTGDKCVNCGNKLIEKRGVEIGNIFQLGLKYTQSMGLKLPMRDGSYGYPQMGCYGIGVGRNLACIAEESSDDKGLVWPVSVAPWHVYFAPIKYELPEVASITDKLVQQLEKANIEVLLDDRNCSPGIKFADSELMGMPYRIVISPKSIANNMAEVTLRSTMQTEMVEIKNLTKHIIGLINFDMQKLN